MGFGGNGEIDWGGNLYFLAMGGLSFQEMWLRSRIEVWHLIHIYQLVSSCRSLDLGFNPKTGTIFTVQFFFLL